MYIQQVAKQLNISKKAMMIYEQKGLIQPQKDQHGYRVYSQKDIERLRQIKCLRQFDFSISQIKDILLCHRYDIFDMKKAEYDKQIFEIETSLQYIDDMKKRIIENQSLEELNLQFDQTKQLKNIKSQVSSILSFERLIVGLAVFVYALLSFHQSVWTSVVALTAMSGLLAIHFSITFRVFLYKMYQKIKK